MVKAIKAKGYQVTNDDEADAIGIYLTGYEKPFLTQLNQWFFYRYLKLPLGTKKEKSA